MLTLTHTLTQQDLSHLFLPLLCQLKLSQEPTPFILFAAWETASLSGGPWGLVEGEDQRGQTVVLTDNKLLEIQD